jgi:hypothetical protein
MAYSLDHSTAPHGFHCIDPRDRNPVVMIHAPSASREFDLNLLYKNMTSEGWCVYAQTYGFPIDPPLIGGLTETTESAKDFDALHPQNRTK